MSEHFAERAASIAALPEDDPERSGAVAHAAECTNCARALREGERLISAFELLPPPEPPSAALLERIRNEINADLTRVPTRAAVRSSAVPLAVATVIAFGLGNLLSKHHIAASSEAWMAAILVGAFAALLAGLSGKHAGAALVAGIGASAAFSVFSRVGEGLFPAVGVKCATFEVMVSLVPLATAAYLAIRGGPRGPLPFAAAGGTGALAGHAALHVHCPVHTAHPHLLAFHLGGVLLAALLGLVVSRLPGLAKPLAQGSTP